MATIAQVAERAGVGVATVSRVINGSPAVSRWTRERVLAVIDELGYEPNAAARSLSTGRTRTIGVVAPFFTTPSVVERLRGVSRELTAAGYQLVLFAVETHEPLTSLSAGGRIDGLLCVSMYPTDEELVRLEAAGVPVVLVDAERPGLPGVFIDDVEGGRMAAEHLLELGHRRIAYIGDDEENPFGFTSGTRRRVGAAAAVAEHGGELVVRNTRSHQREHARQIALDLLGLGTPPTAVFTSSDQLALGVLDAAEEVGAQVPTDLSVIGFDDIEVARYAGLTTVAQPLQESGRRGAGMLLAGLSGAVPEAEQLGLRLVVRQSTSRVGGRTVAPPEPRRQATGPDTDQDTKSSTEGIA